MEKINFEAGTIVTPAKVNEDKTITPAVWEGKTPLSPFMLNKLQENIENDQIEQNTVIDELKAKTIKCLQEVETPTPVSGTSIDLSDSADAKITELKISGNSKQETRSGKNLLNFNGFATKEISGVTITNNNDGSITLNGTATANISIRLSNQMNKTLTAGNYYFSSNSKGSVSGAFTTFMFGNNDAEDIKFATITEENKGFSTSMDYKKYWLWLYINSGITFTNYIMKPQLEAGTVKTDWELYGAMPSPDYPSEVESCGDNVNSIPTDVSEWEQGTITDANIQDSTTRIRTKNYCSIDVLKQTISMVTGQNYVYGNITYYKSDKTYINNQYILSGNKDTNFTKLTFTPPEGTTYFKVVIKKTDDSTILPIEILNIKPKLEVGTNATSFSPYGQGCINEVICNKNILPYVEKVNYNIETGVDYYGITYMQKVKSNTSYILSTIDKLKSGFQLREYDKEGNVIQTTSKTLGTTFTTNSKTQYIKFRTNDLASKITNPNFMLEESKTLSDYIEHQSQTYTIPVQQPMRSVGDIRDTFIKKNNKWYERHYIARKIFDGTEAWVIQGTNLYNVDNILPNHIATNYIKAIQSNYYLGVQTRPTNADFLNFVSNYDFACCLHPNGTTMRFKDTRNLDLATFKSWLSEQYNAGTPVYVDYVLETPIDIECTEEQSTILFDIEQNAKTYDKVTHMYSTDNVSPVIDVTYKKDIETLFNNTLVS